MIFDVQNVLRSLKQNGLEDESPFGKAMLPGAMLVLGSAKSTTQVLLAPGFSHPATFATPRQPENLGRPPRISDSSSPSC